MRSIAPAGWQYELYESPLFGVGASVRHEGELLGVAWDLDRDSAADRALGEAIERSALYYPDHLPVLWRSAANTLNGPFLVLEDATGFDLEHRHEAEQAASRWNPSTTTTWTTSSDGSAGEGVAVPIDLFVHRGEASDAARLRPLSSTGAACAPAWGEAMDRALAECVERHVLAESVYTGVLARSLGATWDVDGLIALLSDHGFDVQAGLLPTDLGVAVVIVALVSSSSGHPAVAFGSSAGSTPGRALRGALLESMQVFHLGWQLLRRAAPLPDVPRSAHERVLWWAINGRSHVDRFFEAGADPLERPVVTDPGQPTIRSTLDASDRAWACLDITPSWARPAVRVAKAVVPTFLELSVEGRVPYRYPPRSIDAVEAWERRRHDPDVPPYPFA